MKNLANNVKVSAIGLAFAAAITSAVASAGWHGDDDRKSLTASAVSLDAMQAMNIATQQVQGTVLEAELDREDGKLIYEVEVATQNGVTEFEIDANTGEILNTENEKLRGHDKKELAALNKAKLSMMQAIEAAKTMQPGKIVAVEIDRDDNQTLYEFEIVKDNGMYELEMDANSGELVKLEKDDGKCHGKERRG